MAKKNRKHSSESAEPETVTDTPAVENSETVEKNEVYGMNETNKPDESSASAVSADVNAAEEDFQGSTDTDTASSAEPAEPAADDGADGAPRLPADENSPRFLVRLVVTLTVICVMIASLLAAVNALTEKRIADNTVREKTESILSIFSGGDRCELYLTEEDGSEVYLVFGGDDIIGYCAFVSSAGFRGDIDMMVGIDADYKTVGVSIVSMSETPGVGTKTNTADFLGQFVGGTHSAPNDGVDAVSGATISSTAIKFGVSKAHSIGIDLSAIASELQVEIRHGEAEGETGTPLDKESEDTSVSETGISSEDLPAETEDDPFVERSGIRNYKYNVDVTAVTALYVLEVSRDDETAKIAEETEKPVDRTTTPTTPPATNAVSEPDAVPISPATEPPAAEPPATEPPETEPTETEPTATEPTETEPETELPETVPWWLRVFGNK